MRKTKLHFILFFLIITLSACGNNDIQPNGLESEDGNPAPVESPIQEEPAVDNEIPNANELDDWNPIDENTFRYMGWDGETNGALEQWIEAWQNGELSQIYFSDPRVFIMWRLTSNGTDEYLIEKRYFGADMPTEFCGYSKIITTGAIYYTFGEDLPEVEWLPVTIYRGLSSWDEVSEEDGLWVQQVEISETQAAELATDVFEYKENFKYLVEARYVYLGQCFYYLKVYYNSDTHAGNVYVSSDGSVFLEDTSISLELIEDRASVRILPS